MAPENPTHTQQSQARVKAKDPKSATPEVFQKGVGVSGPSPWGRWQKFRPPGTMFANNVPN